MTKPHLKTAVDSTLEMLFRKNNLDNGHTSTNLYYYTECIICFSFNLVYIYVVNIKKNIRGKVNKVSIEISRKLY